VRCFSFVNFIISSNFSWLCCILLLGGRLLS
jgi:hypothetical protein